VSQTEREREKGEGTVRRKVMLLNSEALWVTSDKSVKVLT
jgi:hypothetical protein